MGAVECDENGQICDSFNITGLPTVAIFRDGAYARKVKGRSLENLIELGFKEASSVVHAKSNAISLMPNLNISLIGMAAIDLFCQFLYSCLSRFTS